MKWLMLTAVLVLPPVAFVASHLPRENRPAKLPRLIDRHGSQNSAPVLGIMLTAPQVAGR